MMRFVGTNAFVIVATAIGWSALLTPWWVGLLIGAGIGLVGCLIVDGIFALIRAAAREVVAMVTDEMVNAAWERWLLSDDRDDSTMRAALVAALRAGGEPVAVKPLEWEHLGGDFYRAPSPLFGNIRVERYNEHFTVAYSVPGYTNTFTAGNFKTADAAKAAAQADYDQRIRSALVSATSDLERELAEARAELIVAPAECGSSCDDPECPYSHKPLTLRQAYENAVARLRSAEAERDALAADKARLVEAVHDAESLLSVIAEDAQKASDTATWSMASVMAERMQAALSGASDPAEERREALEEAAVTVQTMRSQYGALVMREEAAAAIRALISKEQP